MIAIAGGHCLADEAAAPPPGAASQGVRAELDFPTCRKPAYPAASLRANERGTVALRFHVGADGWVTSTELMKSSGFERLDRAAIEALQSCRFRPARDARGQPIASSTRVEYVWKIEGEEPNPWQGLQVDAAAYPDTRDFETVPFEGASAADLPVRRRVLGKLRQRAEAMTGCRSVESVAVAVAPLPGAASAAPGGHGTPTFVREVWTLRQCGAALPWSVTWRPGAPDMEPRVIPVPK